MFKPIQLVLLVALATVINANQGCNVSFYFLADLTSQLNNNAALSSLATTLNVSQNWIQLGLEGVLYGYYNQRGLINNTANQIAYSGCSQMFDTLINNLFVGNQIHLEGHLVQTPKNCSANGLSFNWDDPSETLSWTANGKNNSIQFAPITKYIVQSVRTALNKTIAINYLTFFTNQCPFNAWLYAKTVKSALAVSYCTTNDVLFEIVNQSLSEWHGLGNLSRNLSVPFGDLTTIVANYLGKNNVPAEFLNSCQPQLIKWVAAFLKSKGVNVDSSSLLSSTASSACTSANFTFSFNGVSNVLSWQARPGVILKSGSVDFTQVFGFVSHVLGYPVGAFGTLAKLVNDRLSICGSISGGPYLSNAVLYYTKNLLSGVHAH
jgi:hypothetical protein